MHGPEFQKEIRAQMHSMNPKLQTTFEQVYRELRPQAPLPEFNVRFYPFSSLNNTIRLRQGRIFVRLSDLLEGAPQPVLHAILHILVAKLYRRPIDPVQSARYRKFSGSRTVADKMNQVRQMRGRKSVTGPTGAHFHLDEIFEALNLRFFHGLMARPQMTWSRNRSHRRLGHYDPAHNTIVVSRIFDHPDVPRLAVEYLVFHEMLHLRHPVKMRGSRRCVHSREFQAEEKTFPQLHEAKEFLKTLGTLE